MENSFVLPLDSLVQRLKAADFEIDATTYYRLQKAIFALGQKYLEKPEQLPLLLSPIVAKSDEEQMRFQQVFDRFYQDIIAGQESVVEQFENEGNRENERNEGNQKNEENDLEVGFKRAAKKGRLWVYPLGGILILFFLILVVKGKPDLNNEQQTHAKNPSEAPVPVGPKSNPDKAEIADRLNGVERQQIKQPVAEILITETQPEVGKGMKFSSRFQAPNFEYGWYLNGKELESKAPEIWIVFKKEGVTELRLDVYDPIAREKQIEARQENPFGPWPALGIGSAIQFYVRPAGSVPQITSREVEQAQLEQKQFLIKLLVFGLYVLLLIGTELYMRWYRFSYYRKAFRSKFIPEENAPYQLPFDASSHELEPEAAFYALARAMKHPQESQLEKLDMEATLYETVRSGGYPSLQYTRLEREAEYLILVDTSAPAEVQAGLFTELMRMLRKEGVHLHIYTFNSDPRTCYVPGSKQEISLPSLAQRYGMHRLIMFSKGTYMTAPNQQEVADWVESAFSSFEQRILLSPEPQIVWGKREEILASFFLLLPFNTSSQQKLTEAMLDPEHAAFDDLREKVFAQVQESISLEKYDFEKQEDVQSYLGDAVFEWLTAAMMYPQPDWQIIMEVGQALDSDIRAGDVLVKNKSGNTLLTMENLSKLATIPWIQQAEWPEAMRRNMLAKMALTTAQQASEAIASALEVADIEQDSAAWKLREAYRAVAAAHLHPDDAVLQKQLRFLYKQSLLDKKQETAVAEEIQLGWAEKAWDKLGPQVARYAMMIGLFLLPIASGIYSAVKIPQYKHDVLFEKYYQPNISADLMQRGFTAIEAGESENAIAFFAPFMNEQTNVSEIGHWFAALAYLQKGDHAYAAKLLVPLRRDPQALYHQEATDLLGDLNSVWHRFWE